MKMEISNKAMIAVALAMAAVVAFSGIVLTADDGDAAYE